MDTPRDVAARVRFAKYRGLKSWRSSAWDPKEGLPREYARVFAFQNPKRAHKRCAFAQFRQLSTVGVLSSSVDLKFFRLAKAHSIVALHCAPALESRAR